MSNNKLKNFIPLELMFKIKYLKKRRFYDKNDKK